MQFHTKAALLIKPIKLGSKAPTGKEATRHAYLAQPHRHRPRDAPLLPSYRRRPCSATAARRLPPLPPPCTATRPTSISRRITSPCTVRAPSSIERRQEDDQLHRALWPPSPDLSMAGRREDSHIHRALQVPGSIAGRQEDAHLCRDQQAPATVLLPDVLSAGRHPLISCARVLDRAYAISKTWNGAPVILRGFQRYTQE
ncbi:uncharacterized protein [Lolium perenne]|uniref:uncharacterized protein n=1 Tax=Lolium perenne TaxID=4522 RepID=UPI0021F58FB4|nr:uncharacterized protein LOC127340204 [Lolium perenne]